MPMLIRAGGGRFFLKDAGGGEGAVKHVTFINKCYGCETIKFLIAR